MIYITVQNQIATTTTDTKWQVYLGAHSEQPRIQHADTGKRLRNAYGALTPLPKKLLISLVEQHQTASNSILVVFKMQKLKPHVPEIGT